MLGNLVENAAKYGHGRVFVTVDPPADGRVAIQIEDDGPGIAEARARRIVHPRQAARHDRQARHRPRPRHRPRRRRNLWRQSRSTKARISAGCWSPCRCRKRRKSLSLTIHRKPAWQHVRAKLAYTIRFQGRGLFHDQETSAAGRRVGADAVTPAVARNGQPTFAPWGVDLTAMDSDRQAGRRFLRLRQRRLGQADRDCARPHLCRHRFRAQRPDRQGRARHRRGHGQESAQARAGSASRSAISMRAGWTRRRSPRKRHGAAQAPSRPDRRGRRTRAT